MTSSAWWSTAKWWTSKTISQLFTDLTGGNYDFAKMDLNGDHGGNIMTATMPNVVDSFGEPTSALVRYPQPISSDLWLNLIDGNTGIVP